MFINRVAIAGVGVTVGRHAGAVITVITVGPSGQWGKGDSAAPGG